MDYTIKNMKRSGLNMLSEKEFSILKKELLDLKEKSTIREEETIP